MVALLGRELDEAESVARQQVVVRDVLPLGDRHGEGGVGVEPHRGRGVALGRTPVLGHEHEPAVVVARVARAERHGGQVPRDADAEFGRAERPLAEVLEQHHGQVEPRAVGAAAEAAAPAPRGALDVAHEARRGARSDRRLGHCAGAEGFGNLYRDAQ